MAAAVFVPLPHSVMSSLEVQAYKADPVYVDVPNGGVLDKVYVKAGEPVKKGQPLAQLRNVDLELEIAKLVGQRKQYEAQLENLRREGLHDPQSAAQIPEVEKALTTVRDELAEKAARPGAPAACGSAATARSCRRRSRPSGRTRKANCPSGPARPWTRKTTAPI